MPSRPMTRCLGPRCPVLLATPGRCKAHRLRGPFQSRLAHGNRHARGYGSRWEAARAAQLQRAPFCEIRTHCNGAVATQVDHIVARYLGGGEEPHNLRSTCGPCHRARTAQQAGEARRRQAALARARRS
jgi:5-methylcytosine-specific restriction enzyme A